MSALDEVAVTVRDVTDAEVAAFREQGWAFLPQLIGADLAAKLLETAKDLMGEDADASTIRPGVDRDMAWWHDYHLPDRDSEVYRGLVRNPTLGHNAARLLGRDMPIRSATNLLLPKLPASKGHGNEPTAWHQDYGSIPTRATSLAFWIALADVTPEMGSMVFYNGSHRYGLFYDEPVPENWPVLAELELSEPMTLKAGDATAHHNLVVHGAPANATERPRWGYVINYFPGDAPWSGEASLHTDPYRDALEPGKPIDHPNFPVIWQPST